MISVLFVYELDWTVQVFKPLRRGDARNKLRKTAFLRQFAAQLLLGRIEAHDSSGHPDPRPGDSGDCGLGRPLAGTPYHVSRTTRGVVAQRGTVGVFHLRVFFSKSVGFARQGLLVL